MKNFFIVGLLGIFAPTLCHADIFNEIIRQMIDKSFENSAKPDRDFRRSLETPKKFLVGSYSHFDSLSPRKGGISFGKNNAEKSWEIDYMYGRTPTYWLSEDLNKISEHRVSWIGRLYGSNNSFHTIYGLTYFNNKGHLQNNSQTGIAAIPDSDVFSTDAIGFTFGFGNRFYIRQWGVLGIDWLTLHQPVLVTKTSSRLLDISQDPNNRAAVEKAISRATFFPRVSFLKIQFGMVF
jgi:hypothetical protein